MEIEMKFNYGVDFPAASAIIMQSMKEIPDVKSDPDTFIGVSAMELDGYKIMIQAWVDALQHNQVKLAIQQKIVDDLKNGGIKLPGMT